MSGSRRLAWVVTLEKVIAGLLIVPLVLHVALRGCTPMAPPPVDPVKLAPRPAPDDPERLQVGPSYSRMRGKVREVRLAGDATLAAQAHVRLLYREQVAIERELRGELRHYVPWAAGRVLLVDLARLRFRSLDQRMTPGRRQEIAAQALAFDPDPFDAMMATYQRFVFLQSLYDIMLAFEDSPLVGCSSLVIGPALAGGGTLLARNFDFEGPHVLEEQKTVFLVLGDGAIPYATVSWPGFVGAASGMNREGVAIVVHGARAGLPGDGGRPVAHTVRDLLGAAHTTAEAVELVRGIEPMVPHMLLIADAGGDARVVERVPGRPAFVRTAKDVLPLTNHFEGQSASDPRNLEVMRRTSTVARRARLDEIAKNLQPGVSVQRAVQILRDKSGAHGETLPLGHRAAVDALVATHSVVMDTTGRRLWVSEGPHAAGRYVAFDLARLLDPAYRPAGPAEVVAVPADPILSDGSYQQWLRAGQRHEGKE